MTDLKIRGVAPMDNEGILVTLGDGKGRRTAVVTWYLGGRYRCPRTGFISKSEGNSRYLRAHFTGRYYVFFDYELWVDTGSVSYGSPEAFGEVFDLIPE